MGTVNDGTWVKALPEGPKRANAELLSTPLIWMFVTWEAAGVDCPLSFIRCSLRMPKEILRWVMGMFSTSSRSLSVRRSHMLSRFEASLSENSILDMDVSCLIFATDSWRTLMRLAASDSVEPRTTSVAAWSIRSGSSVTFAPAPVRFPPFFARPSCFLAGSGLTDMLGSSLASVDSSMVSEWRTRRLSQYRSEMRRAYR